MIQGGQGHFVIKGMVEAIISSHQIPVVLLAIVSGTKVRMLFSPHALATTRHGAGLYPAHPRIYSTLSSLRASARSEKSAAVPASTGDAKALYREAAQAVVHANWPRMWPA